MKHFIKLSILLLTLGVFNSCQKENHPSTIFSEPEGTFVDSRDNHEYSWVRIGEQIWLAENLAFLPSVSLPSGGSNIEPYYYVHDYNGTSVANAKETDNYKTFGVLYNWAAAKAACPPGWHLPTDDEWKQLEMAIGMSKSEADVPGDRGTAEGTKLKTTTGWVDNGNGSDDFGFSGLPGGYLHYSGNFDFVSYTGFWWCATENDTNIAWYRRLNYASNNVYRYNDIKKIGFSVRCVKD